MRPTNFYPSTQLSSSVLNTQPRDNDSLRLRLGSSLSVPPSLQSYECPFTWLQLLPNPPLSLTELTHGVLILQEKFHDESHEIYNPNHSPLLTQNGSFPGISLIAKKFTQAHFNIELQRYLQARECLKEAENFINMWNENNPNPEYTQGFLYILEGLEIFLKVQISTNTASKSSPKTTIHHETVGDGELDIVQRNSAAAARLSYCLEGLKHFRRLPAKAKYIIWTVRDVFLIYCSRANVERMDWMEAILLEMEPYIPKWHFYLYRALHGRRKVVRRPLPLLLLDDDEQENSEENFIGDANRIGVPGAAGVVDDDPLSISYQCMCLAQMFTERKCRTSGNGKGWTNSNGNGGGGGGGSNGSFGAGSGGGVGNGSPPLNQYYPWRFGQHSFETPDQVLECILEKTIHVLELDCHLDGVYLNLSEVHMFLLPPEDRTLELVIRCLKKALRLNTTNPKTHYRLGLAHFKLSNPKQATHHFREALLQNPSNIGAIFGLLQLLMSDPLQNTPEILQIFHLTLKNLDLIRHWDKRCLRTLHYLKGCFHFMLQDNKDLSSEDCLNEAITSWIIAHDNDSPKWSYYFLNLAHQSTRFLWPKKRLNLPNVSSSLKHAAYLERTNFRHLLLDICAEVDDAILRQNSSNKTTTPQ